MLNRNQSQSALRWQDDPSTQAAPRQRKRKFTKDDPEFYHLTGAPVMRSLEWGGKCMPLAI